MQCCTFSNTVDQKTLINFLLKYRWLGHNVQNRGFKTSGPQTSTGPQANLLLVFVRGYIFEVITSNLAQSS